MFHIIVSFVFLVAVKAAQIQINNKEKGLVWIGVAGNTGYPHLANGGFPLKEGASRTLDAPEDWAGRFWARTWCDPNTKHCLTGDCGNKLECSGATGVPPASLAEIKFKGDYGLDNYDISFVDGYNVAISIEPVGGKGDNSKYSCKKAACLKYLNDICPQELKIVHNNQAIGCNSACQKFNTDEYCCRGKHNTLETCRSSDWPKNYPKFFKDACPDGYSYAYDDHKSLFTCKASKYIIQIGI